MAIFKYELRQLKWYTFWWSIACAVLIFVMLPTYMSFLTVGTIDMKMITDNGVFEMLGVDPNTITTPMGVFGFLTSFFVIAAGINGTFLGLKTFTKETIGKSSEFLYTKPYKRSGIFIAKVFAALLSALLIGACYYVGAAMSAFINIAEDFRFGTFSRIAISFTLIEVFFVLFGALLGALHSKIRTPLLLSSGISFMFYILAAFASKAAMPALKFFTPYSYFGNSYIITNGSYHSSYLITFIILCVVFATVGLVVFAKKDVLFVS